MIICDGFECGECHYERRVMLIANVKNLPTYPLRKYVVARYDENTQSLWFYGSYDEDEYEKANRAAEEIGNGVVLENEEV